MIDREKVIKGLECCAAGNSGKCIKECPYDFVNNANCTAGMARDALELLKNQEPIKPVVNQDEWVCGCCGTELERQKMISPNAIFHDLYDYCPHCGKKVDWEAVKQE